MRHHRKASLLGLTAVVLAMAVAACAPVADPGPVVLQMPDARTDSRDKDARGNNDRTDDRRSSDADVLAEILQRGLQAQARDDGEALMQQAQALSLIGARPRDGAEDLARGWAARANALGVRPDDTPPFRGRTLGPGYKSGKVSAGGQFRTRQTYNAGQRAEIIVVPVDEAPLSLEVRDDEGASICAVAPSARNLGCRWVPTFTGANEIEVSNDNDYPVSFYIVLN